MSRTANSRRFDVTKSRKLAASPPIPALSSTRRQRLALLLGGEHGAADQAAQILALGDERIEALEIGTHRIDRLIVACEFEQGGGVTARHAGNNRFFACHVVLLVVCYCGPGAAPEERRKPLTFKRDLRSSRIGEPDPAGVPPRRVAVVPLDRAVC